MALLNAVKGLEQVIARLTGKAGELKQSATQKAVVGYSAAYAIYVHENMEIWPPGMRLAGKPRPGGLVASGKRKGQPRHGYYWDPQGQAQPKFLESPFRMLRNIGELRRVITAAIKAGQPPELALLEAATLVLTESQKLVPVDTGNLKASGFARLESA